MKINPTHDYLNPDDRIADLETENETLRALFDKWHTIAAEQKAEIERLRAENKRMHGDLDRVLALVPQETDVTSIG